MDHTQYACNCEYALVYCQVGYQAKKGTVAVRQIGQAIICNKHTVTPVT